MLAFPKRNSNHYLINFWFSIRTVSCPAKYLRLLLLVSRVSSPSPLSVLSPFGCLSFPAHPVFVCSSFSVFGLWCSASWLKSRPTSVFRSSFCPIGTIDHAQGRAFHHHLARAIMHLNHLAGLLPFFEPSIEWEDSMPSPHFRLERPTPRGLHTFVPLPPGSAPSTMVSHGGLPTHMVVNPEPNLRPIPGHPPHPRDTDPALNPRVEATTPISMRDSGSSPAPAIAARTEPLHVTARPTIPFPVRSKQRASSTEDPQPKKKQKSDKASTISTTIVDRSEHSSSLPIASAAPIRDLNSDDSDGDAPSAAASAHDNSDNDTN